MAEMLEITCACGYRAEVAEGGLFAGVVELFVCDDCQEIVDILVWGSGYRDDIPVGAIEPRCDRCHEQRVRRWRIDEERGGNCPRCEKRVIVTSVGIAD